MNEAPMLTSGQLHGPHGCNLRTLLRFDARTRSGHRNSWEAGSTSGARSYGAQTYLSALAVCFPDGNANGYIPVGDRQGARDICF